ncbi:acyl-homoserine-lactone synthase [Flavimaricola marinus]|uniref:Acyl-homoserine-lactone synthase n=1 Tax=Flavimaricola marinus TaxID=1819565 RepID=A0A238LI25_9RHOB|nr:acyl-homoserine-lactone synthase [Flavimaricola marinus]SMY09064.1 Autoinducer synthetase [Flavimaricola marinus]
MENVTFTLANMHLYGSAFFDFLALRKKFFVDQLGWDIPHNDSVEMDQYDNPEAHYSLVLRDGVVIGGARAMATTTKWGEHTYMLRDAVCGKLRDIPADIMAVEVSQSNMWECTRLVMSDDLKTHAERSTCLSLIVGGLVEVAAENGADQLMSLSPLALMRALRQLGFAADRIGEPYRNDDGRQYAVLSMPAARATPRLPRTTHLTQPAALHAPAVA